MRKDLSASDRRAWHGEMRSDIKYEVPEEVQSGEGHIRAATPDSLAPMHTVCNLLDRAVATSVGRPVCPRCHHHFDSTMAAWAHCTMTDCAEP